MRMTVQSPRPFDIIKERLYGSIGSPSKARWSGIIDTLLNAANVDQKTFVDTATSALGPHEFMMFDEFDDGAWVPLFGAGKRSQVKANNCWQSIDCYHYAEA